MKVFDTIDGICIAAASGQSVFIAVDDSYRAPLLTLDEMRRMVQRKIEQANMTADVTATVNRFAFNDTGGQIVFGVGRSDDESWRQGITWDGGMYV